MPKPLPATATATATATAPATAPERLAYEGKDILKIISFAIVTVGLALATTVGIGAVAIIAGASFKGAVIARTATAIIGGAAASQATYKFARNALKAETIAFAAAASIKVALRITFLAVLSTIAGGAVGTAAAVVALAGVIFLGNCFILGIFALAVR